MKTIYAWTGEYRPPKKGEWYLFEVTRFHQPIQAGSNEHDENRWILDRQEIEEGDDGI